MNRVGGGDVVSTSYFYKMLNEHRSHYKTKTGGTFMKCHSCTLYHDTLNGSAGVRVTADTATIERAKREQREHLRVRRCPDSNASCDSCPIVMIMGAHPNSLVLHAYIFVGYYFGLYTRCVSFPACNDASFIGL